MPFAHGDFPRLASENVDGPKALGSGQINSKIKINGKIKIVCEYGAGGRAEWEVTCDDVGRD